MTIFKQQDKRHNSNRNPIYNSNKKDKTPGINIKEMWKVYMKKTLKCYKGYKRTLEQQEMNVHPVPEQETEPQKDVNDL